MIPHRSFAALLSPLLAASATAQVTVWTVGPSGADFTEIQAAVNAAADGDVIRVAPGGYAPVHVVGKGLRIHGSGFPTILNIEEVGPLETLVIEGTTAAQPFVLDGVNVFAFRPGSPNAVRIGNCAGPVWLQDLFVDSYGAKALRVEASSSVVLDRCVLQTNVSTPTPLGEPQPEPGAAVTGGSRLYAYDSDFHGSHGVFAGGSFPPLVAPQDGGSGLWLIDSEAHLTGGGLFAGFGGQFDTGSCITSGDGGDGAVLTTAGGTPPRLLLTDVILQPGTTSFITPGCGTPVPGQALDVQAGSVLDTLLPARLVGLQDGAVTAGTSAALILDAEPLDLFLWYASAAPMVGLTLELGLPLGGLDLHIAPAPLVSVHAAFLATGYLQFALPTPPLPPGMEAMTAVLQGLYLDVGGVPHASTPQALTLFAP